MQIKTKIKLLAGFMLLVVVALHAMTNQENYSENPCPNAKQATSIDEDKFNLIMEHAKSCSTCTQSH
ncbi:hypothetical protein [Vibrio variabilis]|uniref:hypothetical protein n=1 Tax=Vibrio variabilis TaxID=990271 RepID=UPI000DD8FF18|nr:hypothetical protein [Vibrio variabilis]